MKVSYRQYAGQADYEAIGEFMISLYQPDNRDGSWFQPMWEYMHGDPWIDADNRNRFRIWEDGGEIVAVANYETSLGEAFFQVRPGYESLKPEMLDYAEAALPGTNDEGKRYLNAFVNDIDPEFTAVVKARGYALKRDWSRPMSKFVIPDPFPEITLPEGYRLASLADDNDLYKVNRVMWRGFDHEGPPPEDPERIEGRRKMQLTPNYELELKIVVVAPDGNFVSFCGMWHDTVNHIAYVEPVATDPSYRRMGLGKAAVWEGVRRCGAKGATVAYVGSDQVFYHAIGFETLYYSHCWTKEL
jgi:ribosomal protein S18 acetylase RimI-like enzyme